MPLNVQFDQQSAVSWPLSIERVLEALAFQANIGARVTTARDQSKGLFPEMRQFRISLNAGTGGYFSVPLPSGFYAQIVQLQIVPSMHHPALFASWGVDNVLVATRQPLLTNHNSRPLSIPAAFQEITLELNNATFVAVDFDIVLHLWMIERGFYDRNVQPILAENSGIMSRLALAIQGGEVR